MTGVFIFHTKTLMIFHFHQTLATLCPFVTNPLSFEVNFAESIGICVFVKLGRSRVAKFEKIKSRTKRPAGKFWVKMVYEQNILKFNFNG